MSETLCIDRKILDRLWQAGIFSVICASGFGMIDNIAMFFRLYPGLENIYIFSPRRKLPEKRLLREDILSDKIDEILL